MKNYWILGIMCLGAALVTAGLIGWILGLKH